jgi:hypothetical protein
MEAEPVEYKILLAEYEQAGEMARLHANYRFTVFGYFVTLVGALAGASYLLYRDDKKLLSIGTSILGIAMCVVMRAIDKRTMRLYFACESHAAEIEASWRKKISTELSPASGIYAKLNNLIGSGFLGSHTKSLTAFYFTPIFLFVVLIASVIFKL